MMESRVLDVLTLTGVLFVFQFVIDFTLMTWVIAMGRDREVMWIVNTDIESTCKRAFACVFNFFIKMNLVMTVALFRQEDKLVIITAPLLGITMSGIMFNVSLWYRIHLYRPHSMWTHAPRYLPSPMQCMGVQWVCHVAVYTLTMWYFARVSSKCWCPLQKFVILGNFINTELCVAEIISMTTAVPDLFLSHKILLINDMQKMYEEYISVSSDQHV